MRFLFALALCWLLILQQASYSQINFPPFLAKEGLSAAVSKAISLGYKNPDMIIVGTTTGKYRVGAFEIELIFDLNSGKSTLWTYMFISSDKPDSIKVLAVIASPFPQGEKFLVNEVTSEQLKDFPTPKKIPIKLDTWLNSDLVLNKLNSNSIFLNFKSSNPDMVMKLLSLGIYPDYPVPDKARVYWIALVGNSTNEKYFYIDAMTGEIFESPTSVNNNPITSNYSSSYPSPATVNVTINLINNLLEDLTVDLFDLNGNQIRRNNYSYQIFENSINLNTEKLQPGVYFYNIINDKNYQNGFFVTVK